MVRRESMKMRLGSLAFDERVWADKKRPNLRFAEHASPAAPAWRRNERRSAENTIPASPGKKVQATRKIPNCRTIVNVYKPKQSCHGTHNGRESKTSSQVAKTQAGKQPALPGKRKHGFAGVSIMLLWYTVAHASDKPQEISCSMCWRGGRGLAFAGKCARGCKFRARG